MTAKLLRLEAVTEATSLSKATIYKLIKKKSFPPPAKIAGAARWSSDEIDAWVKKALDGRAEPQDLKDAA